MHKIRRRVGVAAAAVAATLVPLTVAGEASAMPAPIGGGSASDSASVITSGMNRTVTVDGLRLRSEPGYHGWVKGLLYKGDRVYLREVFHPDFERDWVGVVVVDTRGGLPMETRGFVHTSYLTY
ncbi:hypothetical protein [Streptomyces sp. NRRL F-5135]|uniref:hypothetical protein n=1 Tax=Streptomyces sp. NRRL F-5135 TaxID=1463858 RepID=UPI00131D9415|nr:hypothetical protein [Streptomyces sp. NRRL F-5135]